VNNRPGFVRCLHSFEDEVTRQLSFVFEHCAGGDLEGFLKRCKEPIEERLITRWAVSLLLALIELEAAGATHDDIALRNILLTRVGPSADAKLADFGIARFAALQGVSPRYERTMAPECRDRQTPTPASDVWSLGGVLLQLMTRDPECLNKALEAADAGASSSSDHKGDQKGDQKGDAKSDQAAPSRHPFERALRSCVDACGKTGYSQNLRDVISQMLRADPAKRIGASAALSTIQPISKPHLIALTTLTLICVDRWPVVAIRHDHE
jgi:serine/threonine protein kinase